MSINSKYDPSEIESKWYSHWTEQGFFNSTPDEREPYTIVIPPPNVTGVLHMGHMLNNTLQDVLIRRARMQGYNACWVPGTDHASIATEAKVVNKLKEQGIDKFDLTRDEFLGHAWDWTNKHGGIILEQLKKLGASCDWNRTKFTMDDDLSESVYKTFIDLFEKGYIYRGYRIVNWDPKALTAVSDEEVFHKEVNSKLYYVEYKIVDSNETLTIATTRPETIMGDSAICVHPEDPRYQHLKGKKAIVPLVNREVPIIFDDYIDIEFGTGALKVTPAHDINDYELGKKHNLEFIDTLNDDGTLSEAAKVLVGEDRFIARKKMGKLLEESGNLVKIEDYKNKVGYSERTDVPIEPKLSIQWYLNMKELGEPALKNVMNDTIELVPAKFKNTYKHWMENIRDWCISRQLWWGHQIPAYYYGEGKDDFVVARTIEEAIEKAIKVTGNTSLKADDLKQDEDVLDTWFSSWLWPISVFDGINNPDNEEIKYYYPTNTIVTAPEILFFWVARMVMAGYEYQNEKPFKHVYLTGIVRDEKRRKMSKSLGNSPDPIELMNKYGADGVRVGMLLSSPAGNDLLFDEKLCEQGRNFSNKIWNAYRLVSSWETEVKPQPIENQQALAWMNSRINKAVTELDDQYNKFRISDALMVTYKLIWDDFCAWYLEIVKPAYQQKTDPITLEQSKEIFEKVLKVLHPFMPFISEELWHQLKDRTDKDCAIVAEWPTETAVDADLLVKFEVAQKIISEVRNLRNAQGMSPRKELDLVVVGLKNLGYLEMIQKLAVLPTVTFADEKPVQSKGFIVDGIEYFIPLDETIDLVAEKEKLEKELKYTQGFVVGVSKKLSNERFVSNAPEQVVAIEKKKLADAEAKIKALHQQIAELG
tara:strand:+ start:1057 stop:3678 length:2622 start_codon:yes stop_codon:yes gene_type:complete